MLQQSLGNLGQSFVVNRELAQREQDRQADRELRQKLLEEQIAAGRYQRSQKPATIQAELVSPDGSSMGFHGSYDELEALKKMGEAKGATLKVQAPSNNNRELGRFRTPNGSILIAHTPEQFEAWKTQYGDSLPPEKAKLPQEWTDRDPNKTYVTAAGAIVPPLKNKEPTEKPDVVVEKYPAVAPRPEQPEQKNWFGKVTQPFQPAVPGSPEHEIRRTIPRGAGASNAPPAMNLNVPLTPDPALATVPPAGAGTATNTITQLSNPADIQAAIADANDAIAGRGAYQGKPKDPAAVRKKLKAMGVTLKE